jgi:uncharacterized protein involved in outer membrane biogenesis
VIAQANRVPGRLDVTGIELIAGALRATGELSLAGHAVSGRIRAEALPLPLPYARSPDPLPLGWLQRAEANVHLDAGDVLLGLAPSVQDLAADLSLSNGVLTARNVSAKLSGGNVGGEVQISVGEKPALTVHGKAQDVAIAGPVFGGTLDVTSGVLQAEFDLQAEGYSPAALISTLSGRGAIGLQGVTIAGFDLGGAQSALASPSTPLLTAGLRTALASGSTRFPELQIPFDSRRGVLSVHASGDTPSGGASIAGTLDLLDGVLDGRLTLRPGAGLPEVSARLTGPATSPTRTPELAGVARWLAERP